MSVLLPNTAPNDPTAQLYQRISALEQRIANIERGRTVLPTKPVVLRAKGFGAYNTPTDYSTTFTSNGGLVVVIGSSEVLVNATTFAGGAELRVDGVLRDTQSVSGANGPLRLAVPLCTYTFSGAAGDHTIALRGSPAAQRLDDPTILVIEMPLAS